MTEQIECGFCEGGKIKFQQIHFDGRQDTRSIAACPYCDGTGSMTRYEPGHFRKQYIEEYGIPPEEDESIDEESPYGHLAPPKNPDTVTITISRADAKAFQDPDGNWIDGSCERLAAACRKELEGEKNA